MSIDFPKVATQFRITQSVEIQYELLIRRAGFAEDSCGLFLEFLDADESGAPHTESERAAVQSVHRELKFLELGLAFPRNLTSIIGFPFTSLVLHVANAANILFSTLQIYKFRRVRIHQFQNTADSLFEGRLEMEP